MGCDEVEENLSGPAPVYLLLSKLPCQGIILYLDFQLNEYS